MVNTAGCGPVMRGFDPHRPPHKKSDSSERSFFYYILMSREKSPLGLLFVYGGAHEKLRSTMIKYKMYVLMIKSASFDEI